MNKKQIAKIKSLIASDKVLEENINVWQKIAGIAACRTRFNGLLDLLDVKMILQQSDNNQATVNKTDIRTRLERQTWLVYTSYKGSATNAGNDNQKAQFFYTPTQLKKMRELVLAETALAIYKAAKPVAADLALYITAADIELLNTLALEYKDSLSAPRVEVSKSSVNTVNIKETVQSMSDIFEKEIDDMVAPFELINPDFFMTYRNTRKIVGPGSRKKSTKVKKNVAIEKSEVK